MNKYDIDAIFKMHLIMLFRLMNPCSKMLARQNKELERPKKVMPMSDGHSK